MRVLIRETMKTVGVNIYGTDGKPHTEEYFEKYFSDADGIYPTLPEEREEFGTDAIWTIVTEADFRLLAQHLTVLQKAIDEVQKRLMDGDSIGKYTYNSECFLI